MSATVEVPSALTALVALRRAWDEERRAATALIEAEAIHRDAIELDARHEAEAGHRSFERMTSLARTGVALGLARVRLSAARLEVERRETALATARRGGGR